MFARTFPWLGYGILFCFLLITGCNSAPKGPFTIGVDPSWYPLQTQNKEANILAFSSELLNAVMTPTAASMVQTNWDTLLQGLKQGAYQGVFSSLYPYNFHKELYDFSELYLPTGPVFLVPSHSSLQKLTDCKGKQIGVLAGSSSLLLLETYPEIYIRTYSQASSLINDLLSGQIDGGLLPILIAESFTGGTFSTQIRIVSPPLNQEGLRLITLKGKQDILLKKFNQGLETLHKKGEYRSLLNKWSLSAPTA